MKIRSTLIATLLGACAVSAWPQPAKPNLIVGTWRMVYALIDPDGQKLPAYGKRPSSMLVFTPDMKFVIVMTDSDTAKFASPVRGQGTDAENRAAMAGGIGFFGSYTVDESGAFSGNRVEGSTFPNWVGSVRTSKDLQMVVNGDRMQENFQRPDGTKIQITWERQR